MAMTVSVVTRTETLYSGSGSMVVLPAETGELGVLSGHEPLIGVLGSGSVRITDDGQVHKFVVAGGIFSIDSDVVTVAAHSGSVAGA
ncbi:F0F1 ATP synthase subunit epsilon [Boudabousia marimammalium]|uniref:ATP synthase F1 complex delta/epsilon subunit N-terminal domain-containing protein n=1 Tax=Boudabousia marimammalium TaxID=156892 RepID=A0A1Q5PRX3_9ACTO|nr:hypothetical protein [Boudabousia marimammalium]OKL50160.1 hypothetical protein BM477_01830 [Boudabousia marimammalium]